MNDISSKLDWKQMLGFEQVAADRGLARKANALDAKVGAKIGDKVGVKLGVKLGAKVGLKG